MSRSQQPNDTGHGAKALNSRLVASTAQTGSYLGKVDLLVGLRMSMFIELKFVCGPPRALEVSLSTLEIQPGWRIGRYEGLLKLTHC